MQAYPHKRDKYRHVLRAGQLARHQRGSAVVNSDNGLHRQSDRQRQNGGERTLRSANERAKYQHVSEEDPALFCSCYPLFLPFPFCLRRLVARAFTFNIPFFRPSHSPWSM